MGNQNGALFSSYAEYPRLITNAPPLRAENSAPFDNEQLASTSPWLEFAAADELDDDVSYEVEVSTDATFGSGPLLATEIRNSRSLPICPMILNAASTRQVRLFGLFLTLRSLTAQPTGGGFGLRMIMVRVLWVVAARS